MSENSRNDQGRHANGPSMFDSQSPAQEHLQGQPPPKPRHKANSLVDLLYDGFYLLFLLNNGHLPEDAQSFAEGVERYLEEFERSGKKLGASTDDIYSAKYAFCAAIDETILTSGSSIRETWERRPLQLTLFGDQLAGEHFFDRLEQLRAEGAVRLQALEVYYLCLLLGFKGKYALEGSEKLGYLTSRLGDEIAGFKGRRSGFAPRWEAPDSVVHTLKREVPMWVMASVCAVVAVLALIGLETSISHTTETALTDYNQVVQLPPSAAHLTITLP